MKKPVIIAMILMVSLLAVLPASVSADQYVSPGDNIQAAVDHVAANGGTIVFAPGTYYVNLTILNPAKSFTLLGAGEGVTILNGNASDRVIFIDSDTDSLVAIRGFTITNGSSSVGAGISSRDCSLAISHCTFEDNTAWDDAGGMQIIDDTHTRTISLTNCTFTGNAAGDDGGGMHVCNPSYPLIEGCMFIGNTAGKNGGGMMNGEVSAPTVKNCTFSENHAGIQAPLAPPNGDGDIQVAYGYGGGMMNASSSAPTVSNSVFSGNTALWAGAGMSNSNRYSATPTITNCVFVQNEVLGVLLERGILAGDTQAPPLVSGGGGGMFVGNRSNTNESSPVVTNCTFTQNVVPYHDAFGEHDGENGGGVKNAGGAATFTNCIIWGNFCGDEPNDVLNTDGNESTFEYCNIGGGYPGEGNIDADPLFVNAPTIVSLRAASPCVNTGTDTSATQYGSVIDDILGVSRPQSGRYDMGAYEIRVSWSPVVVQPLARTQLASVLSLWENLLEQLPDEPTDEMAALIAQIQGHVANAAQLTNPIYASGQLSKAAAAMQQLAALLA